MKINIHSLNSEKHLASEYINSIIPAFSYMASKRFTKLIVQKMKRKSKAISIIILLLLTFHLEKDWYTNTNEMSKQKFNCIKFQDKKILVRTRIVLD